MQDFHHKICLVTGATSGIGLATARGLAELDATVVLVGRNPQKLERVITQIKQESANQHIHSLLADLSSIEQVHELTRRFQEQFKRLDILVNNAGGFFLHRQLSVDGYEMTFALNHLSYFTLTILLLEMILESAPARIINVSSGSHRGQQLNLSNLHNKRRYSGFRAYGQSKLANLLFTYELARRLNGTQVTVNAMNPGFTYTAIWHQSVGWLRPLISPIMRLIARSSVEGADTILYLATAPEIQSVSGKYFINRQEVESDARSYDESTARHLWQRSLEMARIESNSASG
jgi:NAD(P)-dependent dehydrogenase (short-subunit alcohol dehydrogenase family)